MTSLPSVPTIFACRPSQIGVSIVVLVAAPATAAKTAPTSSTPAVIPLIRRLTRRWILVGARLFEVDHHVLDLGVFLDRVYREVLAVAGFLEAAVGHLRDQRDVVVDPDTAEAQRVCDSHRAADVAGPDRGGKAVAGRVSPLDRLRLVVERLHGDHRAEDLLLD